MQSIIARSGIISVSLERVLKTIIQVRIISFICLCWDKCILPLLSASSANYTVIKCPGLMRFQNMNTGFGPFLGCAMSCSSSLQMSPVCVTAQVEIPAESDLNIKRPFGLGPAWADTRTKPFKGIYSPGATFCEVTDLISWPFAQQADLPTPIPIHAFLYLSWHPSHTALIQFTSLSHHKNSCIFHCWFYYTALTWGGSSKHPAWVRRMEQVWESTWHRKDKWRWMGTWWWGWWSTGVAWASL